MPRTSRCSAVVVLTENNRYTIAHQSMITGMMFLVMGMTLALLMCSGPILRIIGNTGASIISRVMGLILAAVAGLHSGLGWPLWGAALAVGGLVFAIGENVPVDYVRSHMWFSLSEAGGNPMAARAIELVERQMTAEQIAEAKRLLQERLEEAEGEAS